MIISQTPFRVSFAGGGTDLPAFYKTEPGAVLSVAVDHHMWVTVHKRFDPTYRLAYSEIELAEKRSDLKHELVREALKLSGVEEPIEVTTIGDVPAGTGMGSSSTLVVGLLNAFNAYKGRVTSPRQLSEQACQIEIDILGKPIGKQDQYAAAYGGLNFIQFYPDESVMVEPVPCRREVLEDLESRALLVYTNVQRSADTILEKQSEGTREKMDVLKEMRDVAFAMRYALSNQGDVDAFAELLHQGWELKRSLGFGISGQQIDDWYQAARGAGAQGGKLLGAGGGGFLLLLAPPEKHAAILEALGHPKTIDFRLDRQGSRIIYVNE